MTLRTITYDDEKYALVPREPTLGMIRALTPWMTPEVVKIKDGTVVGPLPLAIAQWMMGTFPADYRAMLDAAPPPEEGGE